MDMAPMPGYAVRRRFAFTAVLLKMFAGLAYAWYGIGLICRLCLAWRPLFITYPASITVLNPISRWMVKLNWVEDSGFWCPEFTDAETGDSAADAAACGIWLIVL